MSMSNYPNGFRYGLTVRNQPILSTHSGNIVWVGETPEGMAGSNGYDGTYNWPLATIDFAMTKCMANHGDVIIVKAGHSETIIAASQITCDVAGVAIVGLGQGADRPELTFSTDADASVLITAASVSIENIVGISGIDNLTSPFHVQAANCWLDIEWQDSSSTVEAACVVLTTQAADNLYVNLKHIGFLAGAGCVTPINLIGVNTARINVDFFGEASTAVVNMGGTTASDNVKVTGYFYNDNVALNKNVVDTVTGSTWVAEGYDGKGAYRFSGGSAVSGVAADDVSTAVSNQAVPVADTSDNALSRDVVGNKDDATVSAVETSASLMAYLKGVVNEITVAVANTADNAFMNEVVGNKTDTAVSAIGTTNSIIALVKGVITEITVPVADTSDNAFINDVVGNKDDAAIDVVETSASVMAYAKGIVNALTIPVADTSDNAFASQVIGNKDDAAIDLVETSASIMAYAKGIVNNITVPVADTSDNAFVNDVVGNKDDVAVAAVETSASLMAYIKALVNGTHDGPSATLANYLAVSADFTSATWNTTATAHEILTVTGAVRTRILPKCSTNLGPVALLMALGTSAHTTAFIGATTVSMIDAGELWVSATTANIRVNVPYTEILDHVVNGVDIGYTLSGAAAGSAGVMVFHVWWEPLSAGATVTAGAGGTLA